jgi:hypothetical protein
MISNSQLLQVILRFVAHRFSIIVSDTTGNVKKCRRLICANWPWILNCPDPCHQLNLMMKDIILGSKKYRKIKGFAEVFLSPKESAACGRRVIIFNGICGEGLNCSRMGVLRTFGSKSCILRKALLAAFHLQSVPPLCTTSEKDHF